MKKVEIAIEDVYDLMQKRQAINKLPLEDIIWTEKGKPIPIDKKVRDDWDFTGLNNIDFISSGRYREKTLVEEGDYNTVNIY
jgi:hypothetical protein